MTKGKNLGGGKQGRRKSEVKARGTSRAVCGHLSSSPQSEQGNQ